MNPKYIKDDMESTLARVVEECGEVLSAIGKTQRFGLDSVNPELPEEEQETNADWITRELYDLRDAIVRLEIQLERYHKENSK